MSLFHVFPQKLFKIFLNNIMHIVILMLFRKKHKIKHQLYKELEVIQGYININEGKYLCPRLDPTILITAISYY